MSEAMQAWNGRGDFRWRLLTTVSAMALLAAVYGTREAKAEDRDADRPTVWVELGGQLSRLDDEQEAFAPPFILATPRPSVQTISPLSVERPPLYSTSEEAKISFEPDGSDWALSVSLRFGRAGGSKHLNQQSYPGPIHLTQGPFKNTIIPTAFKFVDTKAQQSQTDTIIDFQAGKDVGLGLFGRRGTSVLSVGVRFAQFKANSNVALGSDPDWHVYYIPFGPYKVPEGQAFHINDAYMTATRSFHGVGPSIFWNAAAPVVGDSHAGELTLDWGINAAVLFGRQKAHTAHHTIAKFQPHKYPGGGYGGHVVTAGGRAIIYQTAPPPKTRMRSITAPDVGGFAGVSFRYSNAKLSLGYRGDFFFGAMDGGIDALKASGRGFYGPFANISVGLGG
jgi:hypothetical protein